MADPLQPVLPGDPLVIEAATWNRVLASARRHRAEPRADGGPGSGADAGDLPALVVLAQNGTGSAVSPRAVLRPSAVLVNPINEPQLATLGPAVAAAAPAADTDPVLIALDGAAANGLVRCVAAGVTVANVQVTDTAHRFARPAAGDTTKLVSATSGPAYLLLPATGTGTALRYVLLGPPDGAAGGGGSGVTVAEVDGSPSYASTTTLRFDQADGFALSQPSAGVAQVDLVDATATQPGKVSAGPQTFGGAKTFAAAVTALTVGAVTATEDVYLLARDAVGFADQPPNTIGGLSSAATPAGGGVNLLLVANTTNPGVALNWASSPWQARYMVVEQGTGTLRPGLTGTLGAGAKAIGGIIYDLGSTAGTYTLSNVTTDRTFNANATTVDELADVLGTLINDLKAVGILA